MTGVKDGNGGRWFSGRLLALADDGGVGGALDSSFRGNVGAGNSQKVEALARVTLILAFSHKGLTGVGLRLNSCPQSRACARRTLILAFSHKGRMDPLAGICT